MNCEYGCGKEGIIKLNNGKLCCSINYQRCDNIRKKNSIGLKNAHKNGKMYILSNDDRKKSNYKQIENGILDTFKYGKFISRSILIKKIIIHKLIEYKCNICGINTWNNKLITLEIDHIDGCSNNNEISNLRFLCPNCHSQTDTYRGKNINTGKYKVTNEYILNIIKNNPEFSIRKILINVGLTPKGANYARIYNLLHN